MININLLPKEVVAKQKFKQLITFLSLAGIVLITILLLIYISRSVVLAKLLSESQRIETELKNMESELKEVEQFNKIKDKLESRKKLVERLLSDGLAYPKFMSRLLKVLPDGVWFSNMNTTTLFDSTTGEKKITGIKVILSCSSYDKISIADFLSNLENSNMFKDVKLGPINILPQEKYELHNFTVEFTYVVE